MADYECPACGGGFPATAAVDEECPWCGEPMNGDGDGPTTPPTPPTFPLGRRVVPVERGRGTRPEPYEPTITNRDPGPGRPVGGTSTSTDGFATADLDAEVDDTGALSFEVDTDRDVFGSGIADGEAVIGEFGGDDDA